MDELLFTKELYLKIVEWMHPRYSINTIAIYSSILSKIGKKYKVLSRDNIRNITKTFKHQNQRAALCVINNYCYENGIDFHIMLPKIKGQKRKLPEILSPAEVKLMIASVPKPYDLCIRCIFNMGAGLRISEIIKLSWNHIRWIDWLSNKDNYGVAVIKSGKGSVDRAVNIPKKLMEDLYSYAKECNVLNEFRIPTGGMLFDFGGQDYNPKLKAYDFELWKNKYVRSQYDWFRHHILKKCEKALNKRIKIHSLRHSRATYLYEVEKVPVEKIQILLGHSSINTTMLYTKINPRSVFEMIKDTGEI